MSWIKRLQELEPVSRSSRLHELIYTKIIKEAQDYTPEKAEDYKENMVLFSEILLAHQDFQRDPRYGEWDDMFGSYLTETEQLVNRAGQFFTPMNVVRAMCEVSLGTMTDEEMRDGPPQFINDPASGCGRFMIGAAESYAKRIGCLNFFFVNQDIDRRMYIYSTMNAILYGIPSLNIHCDTLSLEYWEGTVVVRPMGSPTIWRTIPKERIAEVMPKFEAPKKGLEKFVDVPKSDRRSQRRINFRKPKPEQQTFFVP